MKAPLVFVYGTRPEIIKLAPVIHCAKQRKLRFFTIHTGQHFKQDLFLQIAEELSLPKPDYSLGLASSNHSMRLGEALIALEDSLKVLDQPIVIVQGDTDSTLAGALAGNKLGLFVVHLEAGLRSGDRKMPEEINRVMVDHIADYLFAPTSHQAEFLRREGVPHERVAIVGNTIVDAVYAALESDLSLEATLADYGLEHERYAILTMHRAENVDRLSTLCEILDGVVKFAKESRLEVIWPIHPRTEHHLDAANIRLPTCMRVLRPVGFLRMLHLQLGARLVLTDSGGIQEESAILAKPCVTLRSTTERQETLASGINVLAGIESKRIAHAAMQSLRRGPVAEHPYGTGNTAERVIDDLERITANDPTFDIVRPGA